MTPLIIEPTAPIRGAVIWLHGLGATADDFVAVVPHLKRPDLRFVFPQAPIRPVTINGGMPMPAWYDITRIEHGPGRNHPDHIIESVDTVRALVAQQVDAGVPAHQIVLAGFSQGGAVALHALVRHPERLAGGVVLSAYELLPETRSTQATAENAATPIFFGHGTLDPTVPLRLGDAARARAEAAGHPVTVHHSEMGHELSLAEVRALARWFEARFA